MARYCIAFESMKLFLGLQGTEDLNELVGNIQKVCTIRREAVRRIFQNGERQSSVTTQVKITAFSTIVFKDNSCLQVQGIQ